MNSHLYHVSPISHSLPVTMTEVSWPGALLWNDKWSLAVSDEKLGGILPWREAVSRQQRRPGHSKMKAEKTGPRPVSEPPTSTLVQGNRRPGRLNGGGVIQASASRLHSHADGRHAGDSGK